MYRMSWIPNHPRLQLSAYTGLHLQSSFFAGGLQKALALESRQSREHFAVRRRLYQLQNAQAKQGDPTEVMWGVNLCFFLKPPVTPPKKKAIHGVNHLIYNW